MLDRPSNLPFAWTDEAVETLRRLWREGLSASVIAAQMGNGLTRNAIVGKVHRLGLPTRPTVVGHYRSNEARAAESRAWAAKARKAARSTPKVDAPPAFEATPLPEEELGNEVTRYTLLEASDNHGCMYCNGDPLKASHSFCNQPRKPGTPWCNDHYSVVYRSAMP